MPPTSQLIPPGTPSPQPTEEMHPLDRLILQILQQAQTAPIQPPPVEQFGTGRKIALALASLDPQYRKERIDPLIQQRQAAAQFNPELERLKLLHGMIGPLGPILSAMQRTEAQQPKQYPTVTLGEEPGRSGVYERSPAGLIRIGQAPFQEEKQPKYQLRDTSKGPMWFSTTDPSMPGKPALGPGNTPIQPKIPSNLAGIQQQLDNADRVLNEMEKNYVAGPRSGVRRGLGTAAANILAGETGGKLGLSGAASALDTHAVVHERDRNAIATILAFPLTGSRRSMEGARQSLMSVIPHYSDPPNVWAVFSKQARDLINTARKMPWGEEPEVSGENYGVQLDAAIASLSAGSTSAIPTPTPPSSKRKIRRTNFNQLPESEKQRALHDGIEVID